MPHSDSVAAAPSERFEFGQPEWLLELGAASRSAGPPIRRGWSGRRASAKARRQLVRDALAAKVAVPAEPEVEAAPPAPLAPPVVLTVPALEALPLVEPSAEPDEILPSLLDRIAAYTAKPAELSVH
jgi:hypothetical protein